MKKQMILITCFTLFTAIAGAASYDYSVEMRESDGQVQHLGDVRINVNQEGQDTQDKGKEESAQNDANVRLLSAVKSAIQQSYHHYNINVHLSNGVVTLSGVVGSDQDKKAIEKDIQKINGVKKVENRLQVSSQMPAERS